MKKKLRDRRGAAIELAIMMMVFSIFITTIILTTALLQNEHKTKAQLGIEQDIFLEQLGEEFINTVLTGNINTWKPKYNDVTISAVSEDEKGHAWKEVTIAPTCTQSGSVMRICEDCGAKDVLQSLSALGHNTDGGECNKACTTCGETNVIGHKWTPIDSTIDPKMICNGGIEIECICTSCSAKDKVNLPQAKHNYSGTITNDPKCGENGVITYICTVCNDGPHNSELPALEHQWQPGTTTVGADGHKLTEYTCELCGDKESRIIHEWDEGNKSVTPSCIKKGTMTYTCQCGEGDSKCSVTMEKEIPLIDHDFSTNGKCAGCDARRYNYLLTVMTVGKNAYKLYIQETNSDLSTIDIPEETEPEISVPGETLPETTEPEETEPEVVEICGTVVLKIALEWSNEDHAYKITEWSKK